jgi:hypothetical protein
LANIINGTDTGSGGLITTGDSSDELQLQTAEVARVTLTNTAVVVNESGADVDFRVEGDTEANLLFVDASADNIGMGTNSITTFGTAYRTLQLQASSGTGDGSAIRFMYDGGTANTNDLVVYNNSSGGNIRQNGALTLNFLVNGSERMRVTSDGYLRLAGGGIQFNGDTLAANALDDYEEGTWTPAVVYSGTNTPTYTVQGGRYTKVGRIVQVQIYLSWNENGSTGNITVGALPFTSINSTIRAVLSIFSWGLTGLPTNVSITGFVNLNATTIALFLNDNAATVLSATYTDNDQDVYATVVYEVA